MRRRLDHVARKQVNEANMRVLSMFVRIIVAVGWSNEQNQHSGVWLIGWAVLSVVPANKWAIYVRQLHYMKIEMKQMQILSKDLHFDFVFRSFFFLLQVINVNFIFWWQKEVVRRHKRNIAR